MARKQSDLFKHYTEISRSYKFPGIFPESFQNSRKLSWKVSTFENSREFCNPIWACLISGTGQKRYLISGTGRVKMPNFRDGTGYDT